jgi:hypothetical protein
MSKESQRKKSAAYAAWLREHGFYHGKRQSKPYPNSGGLTMINAPGSSKAQRRDKN